VKIQDTLVQFHIHLDPLEFPVSENASVRKGDITATFTPVPEPSTYALAGSVLLMGMIGYRRFRARSEGEQVPAVA
jgi:hypothetical protein